MKRLAPAKTARVFFALWPDDGVRAALAALAERCGDQCAGRVMRRENIHATLAFIGNVPNERVSELERIAGTVDGDAFELVLDVLNYWRHNRIVWAGTQACPQPLADLAAQLYRALRAEDWQLDERAYVPHVTLVRDAHCAPANSTLQAIAWTVQQFALVLSRTESAGVRYTPLTFWRLRS